MTLAAKVTYILRLKILVQTVLPIQLNSKKDRLVKHTLQPNESKSFPLRSLIANPLPGEYSLFAHNQDGSESSMNLEVQPQ